MYGFRATSTMHCERFYGEYLRRNCPKWQSMVIVAAINQEISRQEIDAMRDHVQWFGSISACSPKC